MAEAVVTSKGFLTISTSNIEVVRLGGYGICDRCGEANVKGHIVAVLGGRWYCPECFEDWHVGAVNFEEDHAYERRVYDKFAKALHVVSNEESGR